MVRCWLPEVKRVRVRRRAKVIGSFRGLGAPVASATPNGSRVLWRSYLYGEVSWRSYQGTCVGNLRGNLRTSPFPPQPHFPLRNPDCFVQTAAGLSSCPIVQYGRTPSIMDTNEFNPYAPPQAMMGSGGSVGACYRQGRLLVVPRADAPSGISSVM